MRSKLLIFAVAAICLVFVSGVAVGVVGRRAFQPKKFQSVLVEELDLTPDQRHKIQQIWSEVAEHHTPVPMSEIEKADAERWQAIDELLTPEQRSQYARIQQRFEDRMQGLDSGNRSRVAAAEEQTRQLLTPAQREKYERLLARPTHDFFYLKTRTTQPSSH
jgi:Spy/CpxP family protein refolding chaperone